MGVIFSTDTWLETIEMPDFGYHHVTVGPGFRRRLLMAANGAVIGQANVSKRLLKYDVLCAQSGRKTLCPCTKACVQGEL